MKNSWTERLFRSRPATGEAQELLAFLRPQLRFGLWVAAISGAVFFGWAGIAPMESASIAPGTVVVDSNRKTIQHLEGGIITAIMVKDGDRVKEGQPLLRLNPTNARARQEMLGNRLLTAEAAEARLLAEKKGLDAPDFSTLNEHKSDPEYAKIVESQRSLFSARRETYAGKAKALAQQVEQHRRRISGLEEQKKASQRQLKLITEEAENIARLYKEGLTVKSRLLALQRDKAMLEGNIGNYTSEIAAVEEKIRETQTEKLTLDHEYQKEVNSDLKDAQQDIAELSEQSAASADIYRRTVITAPQAGVVTGLRFHTTGGVIAPGTPILDLVPDNDPMVVETRIPPQDIDVVHTGLPARVQLTAYRARFQPRLRGTLVHVSPDRMVDERTQTSYYLGRVKLDAAQLEEYRGAISLTPGMPAEVFIATGSHTLLGYLWSPISGSLHRAMSED